MPAPARLKSVLLVLVVGALAGVVALGVHATGVLNGVEARTVDARFALRGASTPADVVVVAIDERSIARLGTWPIPRTRHAELLRRLHAARPRAVVYDVQFTEPSADPRADLALYDALGDTGGAILATSTSDDAGHTRVLGGDANLARVGSRAAAANFRAGTGDVIRRYDAYVGRLPSIAAATAARVGGPRLTPGHSAWIDFPGPAGTVRTVPFADVLAGRVPARTFTGRIVVVGATAPGLQDLHATAAGSGMSGPEIQAAAIDSALRGDPLRDAPAWVLVLAALLLGALPALLRLRLPVVAALLGALLAAAVALVGAQLAFGAGLVVDVVTPMLALALGAGGAVAAGYVAETRARKLILGHSDELQAEVDARTAELRATQLELIRRLARAAELRDTDTGGHLERMSLLCWRLALAAGMDRAAAEELRHASLLHDIGKIGIPDRVLRKPGRLTDEEYALMRTHTEVGSAVLAGSPSSLVRTAETIARTHHERWDGTGYPAGLAGAAIPLAGRIAAICDVFDALVSERPYKRAWSEAEAIGELRAQGGRQFDPALVEAFVAMLPSVREELAALSPRATAPAEDVLPML
ncbi:MAG: CHASE2 domain-containing protein [Solirubrobacteraceae bacterium]